MTSQTRSAQSSSSIKKTRAIPIYYHIPSDHDDAEHPNTFLIFKNNLDIDSSSISLREVKESFPLPGLYHFRFKVKHENSFLWVDVASDDTFVPMFHSKIIAKVLRISWDEPLQHSHTSASQPIQHLIHHVKKEKQSNQVYNHHKENTEHSILLPTSISEPKIPTPSFFPDNSSYLNGFEKNNTTLTESVDMLSLDETDSGPSSQRHNLHVNPITTPSGLESFFP